MATYTAIAPCENVAFYNLYLASNPLTQKLILKNLNLSPFIDNWSNPSVPVLSYLVTIGRGLINNVGMDRESTLYAVTMAETLGPYMLTAKYTNEANSRLEFCAAVRALTHDNVVLRRYSGGTEADFRASAAAYVAAPDEEKLAFELYPGQHMDHNDLVADDWNDDTPTAYMKKLRYIAHRVNNAANIGGLGLIVNITVAVVKRGSVSARFVAKIEEGIEADLGRPIILNNDALGTFYKTFGAGITDLTIGNVVERWAALLPAEAQRLILTIQQISGSGLTVYVTIVRALKKYPDFEWATVARFFPAEWRSFNIALTTVRGNMYYGFKKDLGAARSTLYKSLGWVAKELTVRIEGARALNQYRGWPQTIGNQVRISELIDRYITRKAEELLGLDENIDFDDDHPNLIQIVGEDDFNQI